MAGLIDELKGDGSEAEAYEYALVFPPGWERFPVDDAVEREFVDRLMAVFAGRGQAEQLTHYRTMLHKSFVQLKRRKAVAIHVPSQPTADIPLPVSVVVIPAPFRSDSDLELFRSKLTQRGPVAASQEEDGRTILRWEERSVRAGGEEGASSLTINWLFPAPKGSGLRPAIVGCSILFPSGLEEDDLTQALIALVDAIAGTFTWRLAR